MGALPKRKTSKARRNKRRGQDKVIGPSLVECSRCRNPKLSHHVCPTCGTYNGREVFAE